MNPFQSIIFAKEKDNIDIDRVFLNTLENNNRPFMNHLSRNVNTRKWNTGKSSARKKYKLRSKNFLKTLNS